MATDNLLGLLDTLITVLARLLVTPVQGIQAFFEGILGLVTRPVRTMSNTGLALLLYGLEKLTHVATQLGQVGLYRFQFGVTVFLWSLCHDAYPLDKHVRRP